MSDLPRLASRIAALGVLAALILAIWALVIGPTLDRSARLAAETEQAEELITRFQQRLTAGAPANTTSWLQALADGGGYVDGATAPLAAASLQAKVADVIEAEGGELQSVRSLAEANDADPGRIALRIALRGDHPAMIRILHRLETETPLLLIPGFRLSATGDETDAGAGLSAVIEVEGQRPPEAAE